MLLPYRETARAGCGRSHQKVVGGIRMAILQDPKAAAKQNGIGRCNSRVWAGGDTVAACNRELCTAPRVQSQLTLPQGS
jgi:hypothetical protein